MKRMILLIAGWCLMGQFSLHAQDIENVLTMKEQIKKYENTLSLEESLRLLENKYDVTFFYKSMLVEDKVIPKKITEAKDFQTALTELARFLKIEYEQVGPRSFHLSSPELLPVPAKKVQETIRGTVTDVRTGETLPGVNVIVKGTPSTGTATNLDGSYELTVESLQDTLRFSFVGFATQEVPINGRTVIDIALESQMVAGDEMIVVGYGSVQRSDLTGSVQRISGETFESQGVTNVSDMLAGTIAGFNANQQTGAAGGSSMEIRGRNSLTAGTNPMIVVDGNIFNGSLRDINPNDVESIDVLKDASSAAIYGAQAASGVILITTKRGTEGKPTINFTTRIGRTDVRTDRYAPKNADEYVQFRQDYYRNQLDSPPYEYYSHPENLPEGVTIDDWRNLASGTPNEDNLTEWMNRMNFFAVEQEGYREGREINWYDKTMPGGMQLEGDISISGGSENSQYYWSIGYIDNEGMIAGDQFSALRTRLNLDFQITDWLTAGTNLQYSDRDESAVPASLSEMYQVSPFGRMYRDDGSLEWWPGEQRTAINPLINTLGQDRSRKLSNLFGSLYAEVSLPFGITHEVSFQPRIQNVRELNYWSPETLIGGNSYTGGRATRMDHDSFEWMLDNLLKWNRDFGVHSFDVTLLHSAEKFLTWQNDLSNNTFSPSPALGYSGLDYGNNAALSVNDTQVTGDAMMGRLNYTLMDRYLFTASVRRDGYSAFGQENPRAVFPAGAFAWRISEEDFFNIDLINDLKIRLSYGVNGNRSIGAYSSLARLASNRYSNGSTINVGVYTNSLSNPGLRWEETESYNMGLDIALLEDRINLSLDYYDMTTTNLLVNRTLPISTGFNNITDNIGELANRGFEMTVHTNNYTSSDISWRSSLNFSLNRNEITQLFGDTGTYTLVGEEYEGELPDYTNEWFPGRAVDVIWDYERIGIWQEEEVDAAAEYNQIPGDIKVRDLDGNQLYEEDYDKQFIGHTEPRYRIGLRNEVDFLGNFSASVFVRADLGHKAEFEGPGFGGSSTHERHSIEPYPYWTKENRSNEYPSLHHNPNDFAGGYTFWKDASFVRVQDVSLSYNLPSSIAQQVDLQSVRIFGSVRNLATFTNWPGWDPESLNSPMPRTFSLGLNVSL
ncbi:SusC/RagA family TonB-linked outer membrane protein [Fodinibius roseus]|nr:SusC/RagA family TonB-linked outer membrane protein [Fodinibius roseus]